MLALLLLLALQDPGPDFPRMDLRALVARIPRFGEPEKELQPRSGDPFRFDYVPALAELRRRLALGTSLDLACWKTILIDKGYLRWRKMWPASLPFAVDLRLPAIQDWFELDLVADLPHSEPVRCTLGPPRCCGDTRPDPRLGQLAPGNQSIRFQVRPYYPSGSVAAAATRSVLSVGTISIDVECVPRVEDAIDAAADPMLGRALAASLRFEDCPTSPCLSAREIEWPVGLTGSIDVQLLRQGRVVEAVEWFEAHAHASPRVFSFLRVPRGLAAEAEASREWTLKLRGTSKRVLRDWDATSYWAGEIEIPLADLIRR